MQFFRQENKEGKRLVGRILFVFLAILSFVFNVQADDEAYYVCTIEYYPGLANGALSFPNGKKVEAFGIQARTDTKPIWRKSQRLLKAELDPKETEVSVFPLTAEDILYDPISWLDNGWEGLEVHPSNEENRNYWNVLDSEKSDLLRKPYIEYKLNTSEKPYVSQNIYIETVAFAHTRLPESNEEAIVDDHDLPQIVHLSFSIPFDWRGNFSNKLTFQAAREEFRDGRPVGTISGGYNGCPRVDLPPDNIDLKDLHVLKRRMLNLAFREDIQVTYKNKNVSIVGYGDDIEFYNQTILSSQIEIDEENSEDLAEPYLEVIKQIARYRRWKRLDPSMLPYNERFTQIEERVNISQNIHRIRISPENSQSGYINFGNTSYILQISTDLLRRIKEAPDERYEIDYINSALDTFIDE